MADRIKKFVTSVEAAKLLGVSLKTVQLWASSGVLNTWRTAGGHRRIARSSIDDMITEQNKMLAPAFQYTVLLVEDDVPLLELYSLMIESVVYPLKLITATNGIEGLMALGKYEPDLMITDLMMPGLDGFKMLDILSSNGKLKKIQVVVLSALGENEIDQRGGIPAGIPSIQKPIDLEQLKALVMGYIESKMETPLQNSA